VTSLHPALHNTPRICQQIPVILSAIDRRLRCRKWVNLLLSFGTDVSKANSGTMLKITGSPISDHFQRKSFAEFWCEVSSDYPFLGRSVMTAYAAIRINETRRRKLFPPWHQSRPDTETAHVWKQTWSSPSVMWHLELTSWCHQKQAHVYHRKGLKNPLSRSPAFIILTLPEPLLASKWELCSVTLLLLLLLLLLSSSSSSSSPLCRAFIRIFLRQTMSLGNTVLQLFYCYYSWCLDR